MDASARKTSNETPLQWLYNPDIVKETSPWSISAHPGPVSYCGEYNEPYFLCDPWHIIDGTPQFPFGGATGVADYTAYDYAGMSGPPFHFNIDFGIALEFNIWRLAGSGHASFGFLDAVLEVGIPNGTGGITWQEISGSDVSGRDEDIKEGWSVSSKFDIVTAQHVRVYIKNRKPCSTNPSSEFQLYVKSFNVGKSTEAIPIATPAIAAAIRATEGDATVASTTRSVATRSVAVEASGGTVFGV